MAAQLPDYTTEYYGGFSARELQIWRAIRDAGGFWTAQELVACPEFAGVSMLQMRRQLSHLEEFGHLVRRRESDGDSWCYGFTASCHAPAGESRRLGEPPEFARPNSDTSGEAGHGTA